jgi:hypothetical protein
MAENFGNGDLRGKPDEKVVKLKLKPDPPKQQKEKKQSDAKR